MNNNYVEDSFISSVMTEWDHFTSHDYTDTIDLRSWEYTFDRYNDKIEKLSKVYRVPSKLTAVYLKNLFNWYIKKATTTLSDVLNQQINMTHISKLFELFNSESAINLENSFYDALSAISARIITEKRIGKEELSAAVENGLDIIFDELLKCRVDVYCRGATMENVNVIDPHVYIFNTIAECVPTLQKQPDAIYICYISNHGTSDGYFGFFIKNNGNLISVNERIPEAFIGQHQHGRNHRFVEDKASAIFPYELLETSNYDYKGYARTYTLKQLGEKSISIATLGQSAYVTLLLVILLLKCRFEGHTLHDPVVYSTFYLPRNQEMLFAHEENALSVVSEDSITTFGSTQLISMLSQFTSENVLSGKFNSLFDKQIHPEKPHNACGHFGNSVFVNLYGDGFVLDTDRLLVDNSLKLIGTPDEAVNAEFIGTEEELLLQAYQSARQQLADYINANMTKAYNEFKQEYGSIQKWWDHKLSTNKSRIREYIIQAYVDAKHTHTLVSSRHHRSTQSKISVCWESEEYRFARELDFYNKKPCTCRLSLIVTDWQDIEEILQEEVPMIVKGYTEQCRHQYNPLLSVVDPVLEIQTPFESRGSFCINPDRFTFPITMYFSKSGLNAFIKNKGIVPTVKLN